MQKYLKITQEDFRKACEISQRVWNSFSSISQGLQNFAQGAKFILHNLALCYAACTPFGIFTYYAKILHSHAKLLDVRFLLWFSSLHTWLIWQRLRSSPKLGFFMCFSFNLLCHGLHKILPNSCLDLMVKKLSNTPKLAKNWLETFTRVFNVPIELKVINTTQKCLKEFITSYKRALFE